MMMTSKRVCGILATGALAVATFSATPAMASTVTPQSTNVGGVQRCAGGPSVYAGVHLSNVPAGTEVVFHNLLSDGGGDSKFTITGQPGAVDVYGPYTQSSWKVMSTGTINSVHGICSG